MSKRDIIEIWKNSYLVNNDERGKQIKHTAAWKSSKKLDIILFISLFGFAFFQPQELHVILTIAFLAIIKTSIEIYYRVIYSNVDIQ